MNRLAPGECSRRLWLMLKELTRLKAKQPDPVKPFRCFNNSAITYAKLMEVNATFLR